MLRFNFCPALVMLLMNVSSFIVSAQAIDQPLPAGYYIVVAAYKMGQDSYAKNYINRISNAEVSASYGADPERGYLYVYLDYYTDFDQSIKEMLAARKKAGFEEAWVRIMKTKAAIESVAAAAPVEAVESEVSAEPASALVEVEENETPPENEQVSEEQIAEVSQQTDATNEVEPEEAIEDDEAITDPVPIADSRVYLSLYHATTNKAVEGDVEVVDTERARLITKLKGNEYTQLPDPKSNSGRVTLLANVFGYRPLQHELNYQQVPTDTMLHYVEWSGNHYLVKFDLVRYHKGDINTLFNVYFYNDAAIMLPESKYQLNSLLEMMTENPHYKIMLHGHTNGNARGKIIYIGESKDFFALSDDVKESFGSAKELSRARAEVIRDWLVDQGIAADRIEVKAWGGGRMLHDQHSVNAKKNVRVDVEILEE